MEHLFLNDAVGIWPMKSADGNENCPFSLGIRGNVRFEKQERGDIRALLTDGDSAVMENGCLFLDNYRARRFRPSGDAVTLLVSAHWEPGDSGTLFFSDFLTLSYYGNGLAAAYVGAETPEGRIYREVPLGYPPIGGLNIWILRIADKHLDFYVNGILYLSVPFTQPLCSPFDSNMQFGAFQSLKPDTYGNTAPSAMFRKLSLDAVALWHRGLSDEELAVLSGTSCPMQIAREDDRMLACKVYCQLFDASMRRDKTACDAAFKILQSIAAKDTTRPSYHLTQPFGNIFDPCGAFFYEGRYHVFSYHSLWHMLDYASLDHYVSDDLIHWTAYPIGPLSDSEHDVFCIYLMNHFIDKNGKVRVLYTGQGYGGKCGILAESNDGLLSYTGKKAVLKKYHHDGHVFIHGGRYYTITSKLCRGLRDGNLGDPVMLWSSEDLEHWTEESEIFCAKKEPCNPSGFMEFPYLLFYEEKDVLILGGHPVKYFVGRFDWNTLKFIPDCENGILLDYANPFHCFNPLCVDRKGPNGGERRLIMALYSNVSGDNPLPWNCVHAQPRVLSFRDGLLYQEPLPELSALREKPFCLRALTVSADSQVAIGELEAAMELELCFAPSQNGTFGVILSLSAQAKPIRVYFDAVTRRFGVEGGVKQAGSGATRLSSDSRVSLRIFLDKQLLEVFVDGQCCTTGIREFTPGYDSGFSVFSEGGSCRCESIRTWKIKSF